MGRHIGASNWGPDHISIPDLVRSLEVGSSFWIESTPRKIQTCLHHPERTYPERKFKVNQYRALDNLGGITATLLVKVERTL